MTFGSHAGGSRSSNNSNNGRASLLSLGSALRRQNEDTALKVLTLQRSGVGIVTVLRKMEAAVHAVSTKDLFWKVRVCACACACACAPTAPDSWPKRTYSESIAVRDCA